ncbi:MAG: type I methionyl aminopeptidase [Candidatus Gastranaerophilales bacterium]|nr:type I methionyl aminopeptidase [Candidatus Gastranaerophilales bacterium]
MITRKSRHEISLMRSAGCIVAEALYEMKSAVKPGVSTAELDKIAYNIIRNNHAIPTFKGYHGFPASICASINEQVVHGIPSNDILLKEGDIISLDVGATFKGFVGDSAITVPVGIVEPELLKLMEVTEQALYDAIKKMIVNNNLSEASGAIEDCANQHGLGIVTTYGGHGVGHSMHEDPFVFNYRTGMPGPVLKSGMTIAIEPMFNIGTGDVHTLEDEWTVVTNDNKPSAHFEHTVLVADDGPVILTLAK